MGNNPYKDEKGHWTTKENDGGPCKHDNSGENEFNNLSNKIEDLKKQQMDIKKEYNRTGDDKLVDKEREIGKQIDDLKSKRFDSRHNPSDAGQHYREDDYENDLKPAEKKKYYVGTLDGKYDDIIEATSPEEAEQIAQEKYGKYMGGDEIEVEELEDKDNFNKEKVIEKNDGTYTYNGVTFSNLDDLIEVYGEEIKNHIIKEE